MTVAQRSEWSETPRPGEDERVPVTNTEQLRAEVDRLKVEIAGLHAELPRNGLVVWTAGNVSARVPGADLLVIKPSGVSYDDLTPDAMVVCDFEETVEGSRSPRLTAAHAVYANMPGSGVWCTPTRLHCVGIPPRAHPAC